MNSLSWFIYLAEVIPNVAMFFSVFGVFGFVITGVMTMFMSFDEDLQDPPLGLKIICCVCFTLFTLSLFVPSKQTIYLIAGSEGAQIIVESPEGQEILSDIHQIIKLQLENLKGK